MTARLATSFVVKGRRKRVGTPMPKRQSDKSTDADLSHIGQALQDLAEGSMSAGSHPKSRICRAVSAAGPGSCYGSCHGNGPQFGQQLQTTLRLSMPTCDTTNGRGGIRTFVGIGQQIYSLPPTLTQQGLTNLDSTGASTTAPAVAIDPQILELAKQRAALLPSAGKTLQAQIGG